MCSTAKTRGPISIEFCPYLQTLKKIVFNNSKFGGTCHGKKNQNYDLLKIGYNSFA